MVTFFSWRREGSAGGEFRPPGFCPWGKAISPAVPKSRANSPLELVSLLSSESALAELHFLDDLASQCWGAFGGRGAGRRSGRGKDRPVVNAIA